MAKELEVKVLDINKESIEKKLSEVGAKKIQNTKLTVYWYGIKEKIQSDNPDWFLRIRRYQDGKNEVTWKGRSTVLGLSRTHKEINFFATDLESVQDLFLELGLINYAIQEKYRTTWKLNDWQIDIDQYPDMPTYLEIEGKSEEDILQAIKVLDLQNHETSSEGEKQLIDKKYQLNWSSMKF